MTYDNQADDKFRLWWSFWIFPFHTFSSCQGDGGFVDYDSGGVSGQLQKNSAFSIFPRFPYYLQDWSWPISLP